MNELPGESETWCCRCTVTSRYAAGVGGRDEGRPNGDSLPRRDLLDRRAGIVVTGVLGSLFSLWQGLDDRADGVGRYLFGGSVCGSSRARVVADNDLKNDDPEVAKASWSGRTIGASTAMTTSANPPWLI